MENIIKKKFKRKEIKKKNEALNYMEIPLWRLNSKDAITSQDFEDYIDNNIK